jgi:hypothetical protein
VLAIGKYVFSQGTATRNANALLVESSHELYVYANTLDMHLNFAPNFPGRYLSSNVNITVLDPYGTPVSVPVGSQCQNLPLCEKVS